MDIDLLAISIGNSRLAVGAFEGGELGPVKRIGLDQREDWAGVIAEAWGRIKNKQWPRIAGASVNPKAMEGVEHAVEQATGQKVEWVGREIDLPIKVRTDAPAETGVDRVLNIAAAYEQMGKACVVVDAGTAVTVDLCNDAGEFLGGAIAPGVKMQLSAMHTGTAKLPDVALESAPNGAIGKNTADAMRQGVYHSLRGMVKEIVENYATELGNWPDVIATGGDARTLFEGWELIHAVAPDLTMYGIALAYVNHHIKNDR